MRSACLILSVFLFAASAQSAAAADKDFLYLDIQRSLRDKPTPALLFGKAEYDFEMRHFAEAERDFRGSLAKAAPVQEIVARAYLAEIARLARGEEQSDELIRLKESLSKKKFVSAFGKIERRKWSSPLKNDYEVVEHVDSLEIRRNGELFYVVRLP
jgi:hypothetical protein